MKLTELSVAELRRSLRATERMIGLDSKSAAAIRRALEAKLDKPAAAPDAVRHALAERAANGTTAATGEVSSEAQPGRAPA